MSGSVNTIDPIPAPVPTSIFINQDHMKKNVPENIMQKETVESLYIGSSNDIPHYLCKIVELSVISPI